MPLKKSAAMEEEYEFFLKILKKLTAKDKSVTQGRMMSAPGIVYDGRVFAFYWKQKMGFRAGREFDPQSLKVKEWEYLNPYKNKPPMVDWFILPYSESKKWELLAKVSLHKLSTGPFKKKVLKAKLR